jgi:predicted acetyltransferase
MAVSVRRATDDDRPVIEQLIQLYLYDMASEHPWPLEADGRYAYDFLDRFWQHPYLLLSEGEIAGFALVIHGCPITDDPAPWFMAEFFVLRPYRRRGLGRDAVRHVLKQHTGPWNIAVLQTNAQALAFWHEALAVHAPTITPAFHDAEDWFVHSFNTQLI